MMHNGMWYDPIQGQGHKPLKVRNPAIFKSYPLRHLQWELATDHGFLNYGTISKFVRAGFFIFVLVFVSRDFELGRNVSCEESTVTVLHGANLLCLHHWTRYLMNGLNSLDETYGKYSLTLVAQTKDLEVKVQDFIEVAKASASTLQSPAS